MFSQFALKSTTITKMDEAFSSKMVPKHYFSNLIIVINAAEKLLSGLQYCQKDSAIWIEFHCVKLPLGYFIVRETFFSRFQAYYLLKKLENNWI